MEASKARPTGIPFGYDVLRDAFDVAVFGDYPYFELGKDFSL
jgi:hypothetical protein